MNHEKQDFSGRVKGIKVDAVDTTGAGDAFVAGILSQLASDVSLLQVSPFVLDRIMFSSCNPLSWHSVGYYFTFFIVCMVSDVMLANEQKKEN